MCFAPQRRALFQHLNCQKWSGPGVFCTFWLQNVLRATTACTFSTSQLPKVVRPWCALYILTSKCASRHNGVQIFISHLASWLRTRRFSEPTFRPSGATDHWKNTVFRDFPTFSRICVFCPLTLSLLTFSLLIFLFSLPLPCSAFHLSILSEVWLLNFLRLSLTIVPCHSRSLIVIHCHSLSLIVVHLRYHSWSLIIIHRHSLSSFTVSVSRLVVYCLSTRLPGSDGPGAAGQRASSGGSCGRWPASQPLQGRQCHVGIICTAATNACFQMLLWPW